MHIKKALLGAALSLALPAGAALHKPREMGAYTGVASLGVRVIYRASPVSIGVWRLPDGEQVASYARPRPPAGYRATGFHPAATPSGPKRLIAWTFDESLSTKPYTTTLVRLHLFEAPGDEPGRVLIEQRVVGSADYAVNFVRGAISPADRYALLRIKVPKTAHDGYVMHRYLVDLETSRIALATAAYALDSRHDLTGFSTVFSPDDPMPHSDHYGLVPDDEGRIIVIES